MNRFLATALFTLLLASLTETKASAPSRATESVITGNFLIESCQIAIDASAQNVYDGWRSGVCNGLVTGIMYASPTVCHDPDVTLGQAMRVLEKYLQDHPEKLHLSGSALTDEALTQAFPCKH
jgi:hypothetical protein